MGYQADFGRSGLMCRLELFVEGRKVGAELWRTSGHEGYSSGLASKRSVIKVATLSIACRALPNIARVRPNR